MADARFAFPYVYGFLVFVFGTTFVFGGGTREDDEARKLTPVASTARWIPTATLYTLQVIVWIAALANYAQNDGAAAWFGMGAFTITTIANGALLGAKAYATYESTPTYAKIVPESTDDSQNTKSFHLLMSGSDAVAKNMLTAGGGDDEDFEVGAPFYKKMYDDAARTTRYVFMYPAGVVKSTVKMGRGFDFKQNAVTAVAYMSIIAWTCVSILGTANAVPFYTTGNAVANIIAATNSAIACVMMWDAALHYDRSAQIATHVLTAASASKSNKFSGGALFFLVHFGVPITMTIAAVATSQCIYNADVAVLYFCQTSLLPILSCLRFWSFHASKKKKTDDAGATTELLISPAPPTKKKRGVMKQSVVDTMTFFRFWWEQKLAWEGAWWCMMFLLQMWWPVPVASAASTVWTGATGQYVAATTFASIALVVSVATLADVFVHYAPAAIRASNV